MKRRRRRPGGYPGRRALAACALIAALASCGEPAMDLSPVAAPAEQLPPAVENPRIGPCRQAPDPFNGKPVRSLNDEMHVQAIGLDLEDRIRASNFAKDYRKMWFEPRKPHVWVGMNRHDYDDAILRCAADLGIPGEVAIDVRGWSYGALAHSGDRLRKALPRLAERGRFDTSYGSADRLNVELPPDITASEVAEIRDAAEDLKIPLVFERLSEKPNPRLQR